jgi:hypothetical protein
MLKIEGLEAFAKGIEDWVFSCENLAEGALRGIAVEAFKYAVHGTPEWSGNLAASWRLSVGAPTSGYTETLFKTAMLGDPSPEPFSKLRPNYAAINYAMKIAEESVPLIRLGADVFITNTAPYAAEVEANNRRKDGRTFIRTVNLPVEMVLAAHNKFSRLAEISESKARRLANAANLQAGAI